MKKILLSLMFVSMSEQFLNGMNNYALCSYSPYPITNLTSIPLHGGDHWNNKKIPSGQMLCFEYVQPRESQKKDVLKKEEVHNVDMDDEENNDFYKSNKSNHNNDKICSPETKIKLPSNEILRQRAQELGFELSNRFFLLYSDKENSIKSLARIVLIETFIVTHDHKESIKSVAQFGEMLINNVFCKEMPSAISCYNQYFQTFESNEYEKTFRIKMPNKEVLAQQIKNVGINVDESFVQRYSDKSIQFDQILKMIFFDFLDLKVKDACIFKFPNQFISKLRDEFVTQVICENIRNTYPKMEIDLGQERAKKSQEFIMRMIFSSYKQELKHFQTLQCLKNPKKCLKNPERYFYNRN